LSLGLSPIIQKIADNLSEEAAYELEEDLIKFYGRRDIDPNGILTNICSSNRPPVKRGDKNPQTGRPLPESVKEKIRRTKAYKKGRTYEEIYGEDKARELRDKCRNIGEKNGFYNKTHTDETKKIMSQKARIRPPTRQGAIHTTEARELIGINNPKRKDIHTPYGKFTSASHFVTVIPIITDCGLRNILKDADQPLSLRRIQRTPNLFTMADLGKTPRTLGWYYL